MRILASDAAPLSVATRKFTPVLLPHGPFFHAVHASVGAGKTLAGDDSSASAEGLTEGVYEDTFDTEWMASLDPLAWKEQDHYLILGLSKLRWNASEDEIRRACTCSSRHRPRLTACRSSPCPQVSPRQEQWPK
jgi:hypothetical protein